MLKKLVVGALAGAIGIGGLGTVVTTKASAAEQEAVTLPSSYLNKNVGLFIAQFGNQAKTSVRIYGDEVTFRVWKLQNPFNMEYYERIVWSVEKPSTVSEKYGPNRYITTAWAPPTDLSDGTNTVEITERLEDVPEIYEGLTVYAYAQAKNGKFYYSGETVVEGR
ncbi:hypothetical protein [Bacillus cereus group sp. MYBK95-2]|uniref:hypothetical protein n=1 Tax=unclassified Bacillus cereus group TaxID=2750818 RepID=UPI003F79A338|nr:hypothetical protein [Bacillus cereus]MDA2308365.1 hypothetical protein [Bacillus cereus]